MMDRIKALWLEATVGSDHAEPRNVRVRGDWTHYGIGVALGLGFGWPAYLWFGLSKQAADDDDPSAARDAALDARFICWGVAHGVGAVVVLALLDWRAALALAALSTVSTATMLMHSAAMRRLE